MSEYTLGRAVALLMAKAEKKPEILETKICGNLTLADAMAYQQRQPASVLEWCLVRNDSKMWGEGNTLVLRITLLKVQAIQALEITETHALKNEIPRAVAYYNQSSSSGLDTEEDDILFMKTPKHLSQGVKAYYEAVSVR